MPNGHQSKEYGPHDYPGAPDHTSDCKHDCGCWAGSYNSGGPAGLDPLDGECPNNPIDGNRLGGSKDYENVVNRRITNLEARAHAAESALKEVSPDKKELAVKLAETKRRLAEQEKILGEIRELVGNGS